MGLSGFLCSLKKCSGNTKTYNNEILILKTFTTFSNKTLIMESNYARLDLKDALLIVSNEQKSSQTELIEQKTYWTELVIKRKNESSFQRITRLSDALDFLPFGFVYKAETGMGATHLELVSKRNSIIVEPIKITASSKAKSVDALYVGSKTRFHPKKSGDPNEILKYINDPLKEYKKITVVADSLPKVIDTIGESVYNDYFLLIDEIDSFQMDSTYRKSMEECLGYYMRFPKNKRALLSATRIDFTDPGLKQEPITYIKYDSAIPRKIDLIRKSGNADPYSPCFFTFKSSWQKWVKPRGFSTSDSSGCRRNNSRQLYQCYYKFYHTLSGGRCYDNGKGGFKLGSGNEQWPFGRNL